MIIHYFLDYIYLMDKKEKLEEEKEIDTTKLTKGLSEEKNTDYNEEQ